MVPFFFTIKPLENGRIFWFETWSVEVKCDLYFPRQPIKAKKESKFWYLYFSISESQSFLLIIPHDFSKKSDKVPSRSNWCHTQVLLFDDINDIFNIYIIIKVCWKLRKVFLNIISIIFFIGKSWLLSVKEKNQNKHINLRIWRIFVTEINIMFNHSMRIYNLYELC